MTDTYNRYWRPSCPRCKTNVNVIRLLYNRFRCVFCGRDIRIKGQTTLE